jgi:prolyl oligopeptidase
MGDELTMTLQEDWRDFKAGDLVSLDAERLPVLTPRLVFRPTAHETLDQVAATRSHLLVAILDDVKGAVIDYAFEGGRWTGRRLPVRNLSSVTLRASAEDADTAFLTTESFLEPPTLWRLDARTGALTALKTLPPQFDVKDLEVEQLWAVSSDGVKIPYFLVRPKAAPKPDGFATLMFGYGGFLISEAPAYKPELGRLWLEKGGAYVLADIRGGGEFGPAWHDAALRENRQKAFDDFAAVARDIEQRKITTPKRLGIYGRSNGGILMSVSMTQHPELFGAVVVESPLIDMVRYTHLSAGASWIGEYGDPDTPQDLAFIEKYSAYQNLRPGMAYPEPYVTTNTEDDRVHPGHARKFAAKLQGLGYPCLYYENTFGGHANDAAPDLNARRWARHYVYLMQKLMD